MNDKSKRPPLAHASGTKADPAYGKGVADTLRKFAAGEPSKVRTSRRTVAEA